MKEHPILFSGAMVRAILAGVKTQTRRIMKIQPDDGGYCDAGQIGSSRGVAYLRGDRGGQCLRVPCPYGQPGDLLWVRETFNSDWCDHIIYKADGGSAVEAGYSAEPKWKPSIYMPRKYSRILLEIVSVRVERLQDISREDAIAEGVGPLDGGNGPNYWTVDAGDVHLNNPTAQGAYSMLLDWINGPGSWDENPWVWVISFKRVA